MSIVQDLEAIRPTDGDVDTEFNEARREAVFAEVLQTRASVVPLSGHRRRRWPAVAAAAVAGLAVLGLALSSLSTGGQRSVAEPSPVTSTVTSVPSATSRATQSPSTSPTPSAAEQLSDVAAVAAGATADMTGAFLHLVIVEEQRDDDGRWSSTHDNYIDADGWVWSRRSGDQNFWLLMEQDKDSTTSLPTDPDALDAELRSRTGNNSADERVFKAIHEILLTETAPAQLRAAAITVLQEIALHPQSPETTRDGQVATPSVTVDTVALDGQQARGYRVAITDETSRPGIEEWLVLDATGRIVESGSASPDLTFNSTIVTRERTENLPPEFEDVLGTDQVERDVDG